MGDGFEAQGEPVLDAIQRHPEWLRGDMSSEFTGFPHVVLARIADGALEVVRRVLEQAGAPAGSRLPFQRNRRDLELPFGRP